MEQKDSGRGGQPQAQSSAASLVREVAQGLGSLWAKVGLIAESIVLDLNTLQKKNLVDSYEHD